MIIADTHVHIYPCHQPGVALTALIRHLDVQAAGVVKVAFLAERHDCNCFAALQKGGTGSLPAGMTIEPSPEPGCLVVRQAGVPVLYLYAGRQIVSSERLEVLALATESRFAEGLTAEAAIQQVRMDGGIPVLAWSPGKWMFARGKMVQGLLERFSPGELLVGDTSLRPVWWGMPRLLADAQERGFTLVAGSDPLPVAGEEQVCGTYGTLLDVSFDPARPVQSLREALCRPAVKTRLVGRRAGAIEAVVRQIGNARAKGRSW